MKILYVSQRVPFPPNRGDKIRTFHQIEYLSQLNHQISVICPHHDESDVEYAVELEKTLGATVKTLPLTNRVMRLCKALLTGESLSFAQFYSARITNALKTAIESEQFDWVICTSSAMAAYFQTRDLSPTLSCDTRFAVDFMDLDSDKWRQYAMASNVLMSQVYQREHNKILALERFCQRHFDACFFISENETALFKKLVPNTKNVHAIGNGIDLATFCQKPNRGVDSKAPIFLFTGVMDYLPNEDAVCQFLQFAWPEIQAIYPAARFIVAGMNPTKKLQTLAAKSNNVELTGFVDDMVAYYHKADIFVAPFSLARGVQNKVLQAMACGLPVVTTPMGAEGIDCHPGMDIILADTPKLFAGVILAHLKDEKKLRNIGEAAHATMHTHYSWPAQLEPLINILTNADAA